MTVVSSRRSGRTVIDHIYETHFAGLERVHGYRETWTGFDGLADHQRYAEVLATFDRHVAPPNGAIAWSATSSP